ncbi:alpha-amylase [Rhodobacter lacus]|uniref:Alpha-amylase n=1 Tax=Rhodobacter lacus TaxID=1641972 RepID=A0ABW5A723_9RHOB
MPNRTLLQGFHWYYPEGGKLWPDIAARAEDLARLGLTDVWLPPAYKGASGGYSVGYDTYDLFDLGEFDQKGSVPTRYGDRAAFGAACAALRAQGLRVILDVVFNHKMGADETERVTVQRVDPENREAFLGEPFEATTYTRFTFPGRAGKYSEFVWDARCFTGVDRIEDPSEDALVKILNDYGAGEWNDEVDDELGNYDFLMGADVEFRNRAVYEELKYWGRWIAEQVPVDGFRLDAAKHIPAWFFRDWVGHLRETVNPELFVVAEYWKPDTGALSAYLDLVDAQLTLFDVGLHMTFHEASQAGKDFDMRQIFAGSLVAQMPDKAVTFVENHDTQPLQSLEASVEPWFKPLAYALILMREEGVPCVFWADLFGASYRDTGGDGEEYAIEMPAIDCLPDLLRARARFAHGAQTDLFDDPNCLAIVRHGTAEAPGSVTVLTNGDAAEKWVDLGPERAGARFCDFLGKHEGEVVLDEAGQGAFPVPPGAVSVWVPVEAL